MDFLYTDGQPHPKAKHWLYHKTTGLWKLANEDKDLGIYTDNPLRTIKIEVLPNFVDTSKIYLREISHVVAKEMIVKNHYSHAWSMCSVALGVFYKGSLGDESFFDDVKETLIGCIVYGTPVGRCAAGSISDQIRPNEVYELTRLWIADIPGCKNIESYCIGQSFEWLRQNRPQIKALISYADNEAGHVGTIYQSTNWIYQGNSLSIMPNYSISTTGPDEGFNWVNSRTVTERFGSHNVESLKKVIGKTFWRKRESIKHRYIYVLLKGKERKRLIKSFKHPSFPYPKEDKYTEQIEEVYVEPKGTTPENNFFA